MGWYNPSWNYRKKIEISATNVDATLTNFPLRVPLAQSDAVGARSDGGDLRFTSSDGVTPLYYVFSGWTGDHYSGAYVRVPSISASGATTIYMYYGNSLATDASEPGNTFFNYHAFWSGDNWTSGQYDLTGNVQATTNAGSPYAVNLDVGGGVHIGTYATLGLGTCGAFYNNLYGESGFIFSGSYYNRQSDPEKTSEYPFIAWVGNTTNALDYTSDTNLLRWRFQEDSSVPTAYMFPNGSKTLAEGESFRTACSVTLDGTNALARCYHNGTVIGSNTNAYTATGLTFSPGALSSTSKFSIGYYGGYGPIADVNQVRIKRHNGESAAGNRSLAEIRTRKFDERVGRV